MIVRVHEERDGVPESIGAIDNAMNGRWVRIIGPPLHQITDIHNQGISNTWHRNPLIICILDFEAVDLVLHEDCDPAEIGVFAGANARNVSGCARWIS
jgi:hypothetical protein